MQEYFVGYTTIFSSFALNSYNCLKTSLFGFSPKARIILSSLNELLSFLAFEVLSHFSNGYTLLFVPLHKQRVRIKEPVTCTLQHLKLTHRAFHNYVCLHII